MERYSVVKLIGTGSFGRALLVQTKDRKEKWVMKEIRLPKAESGIRSTRREAVLLAKMKHPNIVAFRDWFEDDGHLFIVMEFCSGGDLLHRIRQQKGCLFSQDVILKWFSQMCLGAKHIHDKRVLHRDLKSKNIFLTEHGTIKLGDFGSACTLNSARAYAQTYVGTPYYVSPEIWDNQPYNNKSDVWSLGCVLYELCTLHHPFQARSWKSLILKVCRGAYAPLPAHLPYELHYLIKHMFKTNPRDRPSIHTILSSHRVSRLLHKHLPEESEDLMEEPKNHWRKEEAEKVAMFLGQKSLLTTSTTNDMFSNRSSLPRSGNDAPRKRWAKEPSNTVLRVLENAEIISSVGSAASAGSDCRSEEVCLEKQKKSRRRKWDRDPPERLLSLLEKASVSKAFETYTIHRQSSWISLPHFHPSPRKREALKCAHTPPRSRAEDEDTGDNPLIEPLAEEKSDDATDGPEEIHTDQSRLEPRSDDEDTDFEDDCSFDWIDELEKMVIDH